MSVNNQQWDLIIDPAEMQKAIEKMTSTNQPTGFGQMDEMFGTEKSVLDEPREPRDLVVVPVITQGPIAKTERDNDIAVARETMHRILGKAEDALDDLLRLARASESARTFEVAGNMVKTMTDLTGHLVDLHKKAKELDEENEESKPVQHIENQTNVFTGTTADFLREYRKSKEVIINGNEVDG